MMMRKAQAVALILIGGILLNACGSRTSDNSASGQPIFNANGDLVSGGDGTLPLLGEANPLDEVRLRVISDVDSIATGGTDVATITALATNINNNAVADTDVIFRSTGGVLQDISASTNANGEATATLKLPQNFKNQDVIVTVSSGGAESSVRVVATGTTLELAGPDSLVSGDIAEVVVRLIAGNGEPIANQLVNVTSGAGNTITPEQITTDSDGRAQVSVGTENSSDTIRVSALDGSVVASHPFDVVADLLSFSNLTDAAERVVGRETVVTVNWVSQGLPVADEPLSFSITAGRIIGDSTMATDSSGNATIRISSDSAGPAKVTVESANYGAPKTDTDIEFIATGPHSVGVDASSSIVNVNETSIVSALVKDHLGNPVKNSEVTFAGVDLKGGQLNPASAVTNSAGIASVTFTAGENATEESEVTVTAAVKGTGITDSLDLTVFKRALNVTLGSANLITIKPFGTQYAKPLVVQVSDGSGTPLENASVRVSVRPLSFRKGYLELANEAGMNAAETAGTGATFTADHWRLASSAIVCPAEDLDGDRVLDTLGATSEDTNNNGSLDPQDPASLTAVEGEAATLSGGALRTDANGSGFFELLYPASNALWAYVEVTARAEALGVEATDSFRTILTMLAETVNDTENAPANAQSPYGSRDLSEELVRYVVSNGVSMKVYEGCTTTY